VFEVLLVSSFAGKIRQVEAAGWEISIFKSTWWMFLLILVFSVGFGYFTQKSMPAAVTVGDIFHHYRR
jgi:preprotein translocase subunit SecG